MTTESLELQLKRAILEALRHQAYSPPNTPNCTVRDQFFTEAASHVMSRLKVEGWVMQPPKTKYRGEGHPATLEPSDMTVTDVEDDLHGSIRYGLLSYRYKPPRSRDPAQREQWLSFVADNVVKQVLMSGWVLVPVMQKLAPNLPHSTPG
jgi:hypothetical protein